jgi:hypothetical protein
MMKKPDFQLAEVSTSVFHYDRRLEMLTAELTTIQANVRMVRSLTQRVFDDACDQGFYVVSHRTGRKVLLVLEKEIRDAEGELCGWHYVPAEEIPGLRNINIFND